MKPFELNKQELHELFVQKHGHPDSVGWSPKRRFDWGYYTPSDIYEGTVDKLISTSTKWLDIGGGRAIFPDNQNLSQILANRCELLVAVDPSENVYENPYASEKVKCMIEDYKTDIEFDVVTFRMVAEHIENPTDVLKKLETIVKPGGRVVIYTINKFSPIPLITRITPFSLHFKIKKFFWGGEEKDTFPVAYKMNSRKELKQYFLDKGFEELAFFYLDDLSAFSRFKSLNFIELSLWKILKRVGIRYPENNLLGIYQRES